MSDARKDQSTTPPAQRDQQKQRPIQNLDVSKDDLEKVKGGLRRTGDPCDGGE